MKDQLNIKVDLNEASHATKVVTNTLSGFLGSVVNHVTPQPPSENENEDSTVFVGTSSGVKVISPAEARLFAIQTDPGTYCNEPSNSADFEIWVSTFNLEELREPISLLMLDCKEVRALYTKLVPDAVSHHDFWTRYFYKIHELQKAEARRAQLVQRAEKKETELSWDDEDDFDIEVITATPENETKPIDQPDNVVAENADPSPPLDFTTDTSVSTQDCAKDTLPIADPDTLAADNKDTSPHEGAKDNDTETAEVLAANLELPAKDEPKSLVDDEITETSPGKVDNEVTGCNATTKASSDAKSAPTEVAVKESSSGGSSDWEKEFDLEMTEDEIKEALLEDVENIDEEEVEGWEEWE
uniref:BSD domain-containing protein 1-like n=1 Tax=Phallusia mammillata TaxID=59560 RepID=A0A6F9D8L3_9ASCI|nr:BSD domain-containing protein 1-like [Phallusia mammillata]